MTYTCNYRTSSSSFKYTLKNVLHYHFIASQLMFFFLPPILFLKALQLAVSSYVTKIQNLWPETAWGERLHRRFPRGLMCFQSGDHLFPCLMSSVINKCMALISLRVVGALELVWSCGDGGSMPEFFWRWWSGRGEVAFKQMLSSLSAGWSFHDSLLSSKAIKLLLTELLGWWRSLYWTVGHTS